MTDTNMRVVHDNATDRIATLVASTTAGSLPASNLLTDIKTDVWRSTAQTASLTATWSASELIGCIALPFCNLTSTATIRVRLYTETTDPSPVLDTGVVLACAYAPFGLWEWGTVPLGVNAYSYGGAAYATAWFEVTSAKKVVIDLADTDNENDYVEAGRLVAGTYWSPTTNFEFGASSLPMDSSQHFRSDAGNLKTDVGTKANKVTVSLDKLSPTDRAMFWRIMRGNGLSRPIFISLYPESDDPSLEQEHQVYGKLSNMSAIAVTQLNVYSAPCEIEEL